LFKLSIFIFTSSIKSPFKSICLSEKESSHGGLRTRKREEAFDLVPIFTDLVKTKLPSLSKEKSENSSFRSSN
jgi:hypothetical protein